MTILIYQIRSTGETMLVGVAPLGMRDEVEVYVAKRNEESFSAGYKSSYRYEITGADFITLPSQLS